MTRRPQASQVAPASHSIGRKGRQAALAGCLAPVLLLGATPLLPRPAAGAPAAEAPGEAAPLQLDFPAARPTGLQVEAGGREVLIEFARPVPEAEATAAAAILGPLLEGYSLGDQVMRLRLQAPVRARLAPARAGSAVLVEPLADPAEAMDPAEARRLLALEARLQALRGDPAGARARLEAALQEAPEDLELLTALAATETTAGAWWRGVTLYDRALSVDPGASELARAREALALRFGPSLRADGFGAFGANGLRIASGALAADIPLGPGWRLEATGEVRRTEARGLILRGDGSLGDFAGTKERGEVALSHAWGEAGITRLALFAAEETAGLGAQHRWRWRAGETTAFLSWRRPWWETAAAFAANAWRDTAGLSHVLVPLPRVTLRLDGGAVRYGTRQDSDLDSGGLAGAAVTYALPEDTVPLDGWEARLGYRFSGEYLSEKSRDQVPQPGRPLPVDLRSREIHTLEVSADGPAGPGIASGVLGWAWDRFGSSGPVALLRYASARPETRFSFGIEAAVAPSLAGDQRPVWRLGGFLAWRFGI